MSLDERDIEELLKANLRLTQENNRLLKAMRRDATLGRIFKVVIYVLLIGLPLYLYFTMLQPYLDQVQQMYSQIEGGARALQEFREDTTALPEWAQEWLGKSEATSTESTQ